MNYDLCQEKCPHFELGLYASGLCMLLYKTYYGEEKYRIFSLTYKSFCAFEKPIVPNDKFKAPENCPFLLEHTIYE